MFFRVKNQPLLKLLLFDWLEFYCSLKIRVFLDWFETIEKTETAENR